MSFSNIPTQSTETSTVVELPIDDFIASLSLKNANAPAAAMNECEACFLPSTENRSELSPIWQYIAPKLNSTAAFSTKGVINNCHEDNYALKQFRHLQSITK